MLRHIFIGPAMPACTSSELASVVDTLRELDKLVPWINNLSWSDVQAVVLTAEFDSQEDWKRYMHEPEHLALGKRIAPYIDLSRMTVVQTAITASIHA